MYAINFRDTWYTKFLFFYNISAMVWALAILCEGPDLLGCLYSIKTC